MTDTTQGDQRQKKKPRCRGRTRITIRRGHKYGCDEIHVIGSGRTAYVWIGLDDKHVCNFSGTASLRKMARAILKATGGAK